MQTLQNSAVLFFLLAMVLILGGITYDYHDGRSEGYEGPGVTAFIVGLYGLAIDFVLWLVVGLWYATEALS